MRASRRSLTRINPIIVKELRVRMRGGRPYAILTLFLVALIAAGYGIYQLMLHQAEFSGSLISFQVGQALFKGLALCELLLIVFLAPAMTSGAVSSEREQLTYEMLLATPLRPASILWGKLFAALSYILLLIFAAVPVFSVVLMFGGVEPKDMVKVLALLLVTAVTYGTVGLFCSALLRRTSQATVVSYALILLVIITTSLGVTLWGYFNAPSNQPIPPQLLYLNPFSALVSIVTITPGVEGGPFVAGDLFGLPVLGQLSMGVVHYGPNGPVTLPIYRATYLFYPLITAILYWISSHLVLPRGHWRPRWSDLGFALLVGAMVAFIWMARWWWLVEPPPFM